MTTRGRMTWNCDAYLDALVQAGKDVDQVVTETLEPASVYSIGLLSKFLRDTSETWTGAAAKTLFATAVMREGNYIYFELGAHTNVDPAAWYKEFGKPRQAAEPFLRPTMAYYRTKGLKALMAQVFEKYGLPTT